MSFERIDFSQLFHAGFQLDRSALILHFAFENRIQELAEGALLSRLIEEPLAAPPSAPEDDEIQESFYRLQVRLDYRGARVAAQFVEGCSTDLEETYVALQRHLIRRHLAREIVRKAAAGDAEAQQAICWESFVSGTLRAEALKAMSVVLAAGAEQHAPSAHELSVAREHLLSKHDEETWTELEEKLTRHWAIPRAAITAALDRYALALRHGGVS
ncbi:MAG: hypothetical protein HOW73_27355 [Polyangiaceae bacterium]|nr:hypothetical protein [Polyangiaceae bacterium]